MNENLKHQVNEIAKGSSYNMRTQETGVTAGKVADCAEKTYDVIQTAIRSGKINGYGKSHKDDGAVSQIVVEGFDYWLNQLAGMHGVHYALKAEDKRQIVSEICEALGQSKTYPMYDGDNQHQAPASAIWADDDPRWATIKE